MRSHRPTLPKNPRLRAMLVAGTIACLAACGDDGGATDPATASTTAPGADEVVQTDTPLTTTSSASSGVDAAPVSCENLEPCSATLRAPEVLEDGTTVRVTIEGWIPGQLVGVTQCADPDAYPAGDVTREASGLPAPPFCDLPGFDYVRSDEEGRLEIAHTVVAGSRMAEQTEAGVTCDAAHACVLNVFAADEERFDPENPQVVFRLDFS